MQHFGQVCGRRPELRTSANDSQVNSNGSPLSLQEHGISRIVITLRRGRTGFTNDPIIEKTRYHFVPATGAAGFPTNVVFHYDSTCESAIQ